MPNASAAPTADLVDWLTGVDPALTWQVQRDLLDAPETVWRATRASTATEGMGARLLALQDTDGQWAGGAYFPGRADGRTVHLSGDDAEAQPWTATTWTLTTLREWGVPAAALGDTAARIAEHSRWEYDDLPYWGGEVDCCINAMTLANGAWLGRDMAALAAWFPEHQLADGGWNCEWVEGSTRSSFHSTLNALAGLLDYEVRTGDTSIREARLRAQEYMLERRLRYRLRDGEQVGAWVDHLAYPWRWVYTSLRALDYLRAAALHDGVAADPRVSDAVEHLLAQRQEDGTWHATTRYLGQVWFPIDVEKNEPSPWVTLSALRVLRWWEQRA